MRLAASSLALLAAAGSFPADAVADTPPNVVLLMADDMGWGDAGYNGHPAIRTPHLDAMAEEGVRFDRFYAGAPVCSPTRGLMLTGRHHDRYAVFSANDGHLRREERTLAEALAEAGYATGHFGKWHLGTMTRDLRESNRGGRPEEDRNYSPPWEHGFEASFSTEAKVPTWNPGLVPGGWERPGESAGDPYPTAFWTGPGQRETEDLLGDASRVVMDRAIPFIEQAVADGRPFLAVVWFHAPHEPVIAGPEHRAPYHEFPEAEQHYYGCLTAMDEQIGRLRDRLADLGVADDTMVWFTSDNGPSPDPRWGRGSAGPFRDGKFSLREGGIRVPGLLEWPAGVPEPRVVEQAISVGDLYPTILRAAGVLDDPRQPLPLDGVDIMPLLRGGSFDRGGPLFFRHGGQTAVVDERLKLVHPGPGGRFELYDLAADPGESENLADTHPEEVGRLAAALEAWMQSCRESLDRRDYGTGD